MTTPPKAPRYRTSGPGSPRSTARAGVVDTPQQVSREEALEAIRKEGLTGRQLRMARRVAQKHNLAVTSDFDAVYQLRAQGIDPFKRSSILDLSSQSKAPEPDKVQLPQTMDSTSQSVPSTEIAARQKIMDDRAGELRALQIELARRRQRNVALLALRLLFFVVLPTALAGYYFSSIATQMYTTRAEFVIQQAEPPSAGGLGGLFQGTSMATQQDSISVQSYLSSREAMLRLDAEHGFRAHFSQSSMDPFQILTPGDTLNDAYKVYRKRVEISYDPTEGLVRLDVSAASPEKSLEFTQALISYAEEQVDQMTARLRHDQMSGAQENYKKAEAEREAALAELTRVQSEVEVIDPVAESSALMGRITTLEGQRDGLEIELAGLLDNPRPNSARVGATQARIDRINAQIDMLRAQITQGQSGRLSQTEMNAIIRAAEENYQSRLLLVQEALGSLEMARQQANSQVRYLSLSVRPIPPDAPTYPRVFENTAVCFLIFTGIYLMLALTAAIIREQLSA